MKSKFFMSMIALSIFLVPTYTTYANDNINNADKNIECSNCIVDNDVEMTLCETHSKELNVNTSSRCGGDVGLATGPNGNVINSPVRSWSNAPLYPNLQNYYFVNRNKVGTNQHSMVGIWDNRSPYNYVTAFIEDGNGRNITQGGWYNLNTDRRYEYYQINTPGAYYNQTVRLGIESYKPITYTGYCAGAVDYH